MTTPINAQTLTDLWLAQMTAWDVARHNYEALEKAEKRMLTVDGITVGVQHNPGRLTSVSSQPQSYAHKPQLCFLCPDALPAEQLRADYCGEYTVLVNPYPIFARHFTIAASIHAPQRIEGRMPHLLALAAACRPYTFFYNGPRCGASAPMHAHFQACNAGIMPIEQQCQNTDAEEIATSGTAHLYLLHGMLRTIFMLTATDAGDALALWQRLYRALPSTTREEPMLNIIARQDAGQWTLLIFPRKKHRPACYHAEGENHYLISPGAVEMGGLFITPRHEDYSRLDGEVIKEIYSEVSPTPTETARICQQI